MGAGFGVHLLEVVTHHRREHAAPPLVGVHAHPAQARAGHLAQPASGPGTESVIGKTP